MMMWVPINENVKMTDKEGLRYCELKQLKPWLEEGCSKQFHQRKHAKFYWLWDSSQINCDNKDNVICEMNRHFRNKKREYMKDNINELAHHSKIKNIRNLHRGIA
jgi:hypothetical protein